MADRRLQEKREAALDLREMAADLEETDIAEKMLRAAEKLEEECRRELERAALLLRVLP